MLTIPRTNQDELIFKTNKVKLFWGSLILWPILGIVIIGSYWGAYGSIDPSTKALFAFWALLLTAPVLLFFNIVSFLPQEGMLTLNTKGFQFYSHLKSRRHHYQWSDIQRFFITHQQIGRTTRARISFLVNQAGIARQKHLASYRYHTSLEEIVTILNEWKGRYAPITAEEESAWTAPMQSLLPKKQLAWWKVALIQIGIAVIFGGIWYFFGFQSTLTIQNQTGHSLHQLTLLSIENPINVYELPSLQTQELHKITIPRFTPHVIRILYVDANKKYCAQLERTDCVWQSGDSLSIKTNNFIHVGLIPCKERAPHPDNLVQLTQCQGYRSRKVLKGKFSLVTQRMQ